jgi:peptidoglycan/LPS O-acetylase OafA/YrhL
MQKIKNIEFLRIIGCIAVIVLHLFREPFTNLFSDIEIYNKGAYILFNGQKSVDLFFIISGFFFAYLLNTKYSLLDFIKKKLIRLYPVAIFTVIVSFLISLTGVIKFNLYSNILVLLNLHGTAMSVNLPDCQLKAFWYVSSMLWVLGIYYYLLKNFDKKIVNLAIFLIVFLCYSFLINAKGGKINSVEQTFYHIFNVGFMRALAGLGVGYFIGEWWKENKEKIQQISLNIYQKLAITALEFVCLYFMINNLVLHRLKFQNHMIFIVDFIAIIMLFIIKKGFISQILNDTILGDISVNIAKYTYSLYITHKLIFAILVGSFWKFHPQWVYAHPIENVVMTLLLVVIFGAFTYHFVEAPCARYFSKKAETRLGVESLMER